MKVVILAGGRGTRIAEETHLRPKPMVEIGGYPILWHIMKLFGHYGYRDFIICLGYKGYVIKEYFANYILHSSDITVDMATGRIDYHRSQGEPWSVTLVDTGDETLTGGRLKRVRDHLDADAPFFFTYGDGLSDIDLNELERFHRAHGRQATITGVVPPGRYGALEIVDTEVRKLVEKPPGDEGTINGGFFVLEPSVLDRIADDGTTFEAQPLEGLARDRQLIAFRHAGFWAAMDTIRDRNNLEKLWAEGRAPWRVSS